jgi:hypothetical protein
MMKTLWALGFLIRALAAEPSPSPWLFSVGAGAGYESGNGLHLGLGQGRNMGELGLGLIYVSQDAEFQYSTGLRFRRILYSGRINDTYAWVGAAVHGHYRSGDYAYLESQGLGVGVSLHLGLPFHLNVDSGWHGFYDSDAGALDLQWGPTLNGELVYQW